MFIIQILLEIAVVLLIAYGVWHEEELIELETVLKQFVKKEIKKKWKKGL